VADGAAADLVATAAKAGVDGANAATLLMERSVRKSFMVDLYLYDRI